MRYGVLLLLPMILFGYTHNIKEICANIEKVANEAELIYERFDDSDNALKLLHASEFTSLFNQRLECPNKLKKLDLYVDLQAKAKNARINYTQLEILIKQYPSHLHFYKALGALYHNQFIKHKNPNFLEKSINLYTQYIDLAKKQGVEPDLEIIDFVKTGGLQKVKSTWGKYLNPSHQVPLGAFKAFYINSKDPKKVVASEVVKDISINYPYDKFHGIDSGQFGAYWVGKISFDKTIKKHIYIDQSWSKTRIIIDGYVVYNGGHKGEAVYTFSKGIHTIEVEFLNAWHTTQLSVKFFDDVHIYRLNQLKDELQKVVTPDTNFNYVGIYESREKDQSVKLKIKTSAKPIVLLLQSYAAVIWKIENPHNVKIQAIVLNSAHPLSDVRGDIKGVKIFYSKKRVGSGYKLGLPKEKSLKNCCIGNHFNCSYASLLDVENSIPRIFKKKVFGFSAQYGTKSMDVPEVVVNESMYQDIIKWNKKVDQLKAKCTKNSQITPEELFK